MNISGSLLEHYKDLMEGNGLKIPALSKDDIQKLFMYAITQVNEKLRVLEHNLSEILKAAEAAKESKKSKWEK